jgi:hypothetical protein
MNMLKYLASLTLIGALFGTPAFADWTGKDATPATITFKNAGNCTAVVCVPQTALTDSTGVNFASFPTAGADAVSNTSTGILTYGRNLVFNGATWDRWTGAVTNAGTFAVQLSGATNNINNISGTISLPTGAGTSANQASQLTQETAINTVIGTQGDTACATDNGTCTVVALQKRTNQNQTTQTAAINAAIPPCAAAPCVTTIGNIGFDPSSGKGTPTQAFLALPATTTTQIIALSGSKVTYVTVAKVLAGGTVNVTFKYGTGANCVTGTTTLEGPYPLTAQAGWVEGNGAGPVMIVPSGQALCVTTDASVTGGVKLVFQQI